MSKMGASCIWKPQVGDEVSILYNDFLALVGDERPVTNYYYAQYLQPGIAEAMDTAGFKRNKQGQHSAKDVYAFLEADKGQRELRDGYKEESKRLGVMDYMDKLIDLDMKTAYQKALDENNRSKGYVARVVQFNDKFHVILDRKGSDTFLNQSIVAKQKMGYDLMISEFRARGIDVDRLEKDFVGIMNPLTVESFLLNLRSNSSPNVIKYLSADNIKLILELAPTTKLQNILNTRGWGTVDEVANKMHDILHNQSNYAPDIVNLVTSAIAEGGQFIRTMVSDISTKLTGANLTFDFNDKNADINHTLEDLDAEFGIGKDVTIIDPKHLNRLSEVAANAIMILDKQIDKIEKTKGRTKQSEELRGLAKSLAKEREKKKYYRGLISFVGKANDYIGILRRELASVPLFGTRIDRIKSKAGVLTKMSAMLDTYTSTINALSNIDSIILDESMRSEDIETLKSLAREVGQNMSEMQKALVDARKNVMIDQCAEVFGETVDGMDVANYVQSISADSSIMDWLYSINRQTNPLIGAMGSVFYKAQQSRNKRLTEIDRRIRQITSVLQDSGSDTKFMYELVDGVYYIVSDIDWSAYNKALNRERAKLHKQHLTAYEFQDAINQWIEDNTMSIIVDEESGRTTKIPSMEFHKSEDFQEGWTDAQKEYYEEMMGKNGLMGQIGTLLPDWAQHHFRPPQRRQSDLDIFANAKVKNKSFKESVKDLIRHHNLRKKDDDTQYGSVFVTSEELQKGRATMDGQILREVPIFYVNKLKDQSDLLLDFSGGIMSLASTAIHFDEMNNVRSTIEVMADFIKEELNSNAKNGKKTLVDIVDTGVTTILRKIKGDPKFLDINGLVDGFLDKHLFGIEMKDDSDVARAVGAIINYTSLNQLAPNIKGAVSNYLVGEYQMLIEGLAGTLGGKKAENVPYKLKDYVRANALVFGTKVTPGVYMDHMTNNKNSKAGLLEEMFNPLQDLAADYGGARYYNSFFRKMWGGFDAMGLYGMGEATIHYVNMYAVLCNQKVLDDKGKEVSLYDAFEVSDIQRKNGKLTIKDGYKKLDGTAIDGAYLDSVRNIIWKVNQDTHGSMNREDKGLIHQHMAGRAVMNFRQWMVEHYSRRYRGRHWDATLGRFTEGYYNTVYKLVRDIIKDAEGFNIDITAHWNNLDADQKHNVRKAAAEFMLWPCLLTLNFAMGSPSDDEHKRNRRWKFWKYQVQRLLLDEETSMPILIGSQGSLPTEIETIINSPIASTKTIENWLYPLYGLTNGDLLEDGHLARYKTGRHKGEWKYGSKLMRKTMPFYGQIESFINMDKDNSVFAIFNKN